MTLRFLASIVCLTLLTSGCALLSGRIAVLPQGYCPTLQGQRIGVGWVDKGVPTGQLSSKRPIWELKVCLIPTTKEVLLYKGDTLHLDHYDWKVIHFLHGSKRNRAYLKQLGPLKAGE